MSSTTTQILFNSPALHSLKRGQLVQLCKIHSIKASGKNVDLIERLKQHAETLPKDAPLSVASRSEDNTIGTIQEIQELINDGHHENVETTFGGNQPHMPRPSEQWEIVMEPIQEADERSSQATISSSRTTGNFPGEFGTVGSKTTSVSSSIKAFATSLGLKRGIDAKTTFASTSSKQPSSSESQSMRSADELIRHAVPYSSLLPSTAPQTDLFTFDTSKDTNFNPEPIPGHILRPGCPAPPNARLSIGSTATPGPTTTIRLLPTRCAPGLTQPSTPILKPFDTTFDLVMETPLKQMNVNSQKDTLDPTLPALDGLDKDQENTMMPRDTTPMKKLPAIPVNNPLSPANSSVVTPQASLNPPPAQFIFGSPLPEHKLSNQQFRNVAASVLEEMNKRLAGGGVATLGIDILDRAKPPGSNLTEGLGKAKKAGFIGERFDRVHEQEFSKMESIASYAAKRESPPKKRKSSAMSAVDGGRRRPSGVRASGARVISNGRRKAVMPGGFGDEDDDDGDREKGNRKRPRVERDVEPAEGAQDKSKSVTIAPPVCEGESVDEEDRKRKEKEAIRRKLEMNKARRRSSRGRVSVGGGKAPLISNQKKRFGFFSSAKSMVQNVWSKSLVLSKPALAPAPPSNPKPSAVMRPPLPKKTTPASVPTVNASLGNKNIPTRIGRKTSTSNALKPTGSLKSTASVRSKSPAPSLTRSSNKSIGGSMNSSKTGSLSGGSVSTSRISSRFGSRNSSITGAPSAGTMGNTNRSRVSSMGTRVSSANVNVTDKENTAAKQGGTERSSERLKRTNSSRLLAPTANSLQRTQSKDTTKTRTLRSNASRPEQNHGKPVALPAVREDRPDVALDQITNSSGLARRQVQPLRSGTIFSRPLTGLSLIPTPTANGTDVASGKTDVAAPKEPVRGRALPQRKPRISRSRVISRLISQRAASSSQSGNGKKVGVAETTSGRLRSSLGATKRPSLGGTKIASMKNDVVMSAKKRARQSEYARRRSRTTPDSGA